MDINPKARYGRRKRTLSVCARSGRCANGSEKVMIKARTIYTVNEEEIKG